KGIIVGQRPQSYTQKYILPKPRRLRAFLFPVMIKNTQYIGPYAPFYRTGCDAPGGGGTETLTTIIIRLKRRR
ncbi:MAG TPA: hypothetical protein VLS48_04890, partial [Anaerolineales bacterium]|nr:hypothetical protein [Anaerolineales bacterium]